MKITASNLIRSAGLCAIVAGVCYIIVGLFHPLNVIASVTTTRWAIVHVFATAMCFFGLFGIAGIYASHRVKYGWLGLIGFVLLSVWFVVTMGFTLMEVFVLPRMATESPAYVSGFLGMFTGAASEVNFGILPTLWTLTGPLYMLGGLLFGIATIRAGILSRWAGGLLALGTALAPVAALLPPAQEPLVAVPVGVALAWLGYRVLAERGEKTTQAVLDQRTVQPEPSKVV